VSAVDWATCGGRASIDRLSPDDRLNLDADIGPAPVHLGAVIRFGGDAEVGVLDAIADLADRFSRIPRLRQCTRPAPFGGGLPVWVDDPTFAPSHHLTQVECPAPGDEGALIALASSLLTEPLPVDRPLWRAVLVTGLDAGDLALVVIAHHALADGLGGLALLAHVVDERPPTPPAAPPRPAPGGVRLVVDNVQRHASTLRRLPAALGQLPDSVAAIRTGTRDGGVEPATLLGPTGPHRSVSVVRLDLAEVIAAAHAAGVTVNDVLLTAVGGSLGALLAERGERLDSMVLSMPVSARTAATAGEPGNQVGAVPIRVPVTGDPLHRLAATAARTSLVKQVPAGGSGRLFDAVTHALARLHLLRWVMEHQAMVHSFVTDVIGPTEPVRLLGTEVTDVVAMACTPGDIPAAFVALSYAGTLTVSVVVDPDAAADLAGLRDRFAAELSAVVTAASAVGSASESA
jgi:diacylglycerol O-acyltransferase / wax synthase